MDGGLVSCKDGEADPKAARRIAEGCSAGKVHGAHASLIGAPFISTVHYWCLLVLRIGFP